MTPEFATAEELVAYVEGCLGEGDHDAAQKAVSLVGEQHPDSPLAQHLAGLVWERAYLDQNAAGQKPPLELYRKAEHHYRRACELDPDTPGMHMVRLQTCLFVLGTQWRDVERLREATGLALQIRDFMEGTESAFFGRQAAVCAGALANITHEQEDYDRAEEYFDDAEMPQDDREDYFFHHFRGMLKRMIGQREQDPARLRQAIESFVRARATTGSVRGMEYLLADCLVQLDDPDAEEVRLMDETVRGLTGVDDRLVASLRERWRLRHKLLGSPVPD